MYTALCYSLMRCTMVPLDDEFVGFALFDFDIRNKHIYQ